MADGQMGSNPQRPLREDFLVLLIQDVITAIARHEAEGSQANRRDLIRTIFVAVEGAVWDFRTGTVETARSLDLLTREEELAFEEIGYVVTEQGKIRPQPRFIPLLALIRLTSNLASRINQDFKGQFDGKGWSDFRQAMKIRNRITHPKRKADLVLNSSDVDVSIDALEWLLELHRGAMEAVLDAMRQHSLIVDEVVQGLINRDPELLALYDEIARKSEN